MPTTKVTRNATVLGVAFNTDSDIDADSGQRVDPNLPAAKTGTLTVRTDNNTGTLTMTSGHGIPTGAKIDLYWDGGSQRNITVGTVSVNSVPIDLGTGDNLPAAAAAITAMVQDVEPVTVTGDDLLFAGFQCDAAATCRIMQSDGTLIKEYSVAAGKSKFWDSASGEDNPFAGVDIGKVALTHGDSTAARRPRFAYLNSSPAP